MDRLINYPGQIPLETDLLNTNRSTMLALGKVIAAVLGTGNLVNGLTVSPNSPAALNVVVAPGEIYSLQNVDGTAYSSLPADTAHTCMKQGISLEAVTIGCAAPTTAGFSINYLIEATFQEIDSANVVLPYYNASNPTQAYSGPGNSGTAQATMRQGKVIVQAKAGIAAATGSQVTPVVDAGYVALAVVTVANGQTTISAGNISAVVNSQVLTQSILAQLYSSRCQLFTASGSIVVPAGVNTMYLTGCAGGGGGAAGGGGGGLSNSFGGGGGGGGAGESVYRQAFSVTPGSTVNISIGTAGLGGTGIVVGPGNPGSAGGNTVISGAITKTLTGGSGGAGGIASTAGPVPGGSGGNGFPGGSWGADGAAGAATGNGGAGASSPFGGGGGRGRASIIGTGQVGFSAFGYGAGGGGGGGVYGTGSSTSYTGGKGGDGTPGMALLEWN